MTTRKARLDADRTAKPKTRILTHAREGDAIGPGSPLRDPQWEAEDGGRVALAAPVPPIGRYVKPCPDCNLGHGVATVPRVNRETCGRCKGVGLVSADPPRPTPTAVRETPPGCAYQRYSSRTCERGTNGCTVKHEAACSACGGTGYVTVGAGGEMVGAWTEPCPKCADAEPRPTPVAVAEMEAGVCGLGLCCVCGRVGRAGRLDARGLCMACAAAAAFVREFKALARAAGKPRPTEPPCGCHGTGPHCPRHLGEPRITRSTDVLCGDWRIGGTRLPTSTIWSFRHKGIDYILSQYPDITREDVKAALAHEKALRAVARPKAPGPRRRAERLVRVERLEADGHNDEHVVILGPYVWDRSSNEGHINSLAAQLRTCLAREFDRAADARARRELLRAARELRNLGAHMKLRGEVWADAADHVEAMARRGRK